MTYVGNRSNTIIASKCISLDEKFCILKMFKNRVRSSLTIHHHQDHNFICFALSLTVSEISATFHISPIFLKFSIFWHVIPTFRPFCSISNRFWDKSKLILFFLFYYERPILIIIYRENNLIAPVEVSLKSILIC